MIVRHQTDCSPTSLMPFCFRFSLRGNGAARDAPITQVRQCTAAKLGLGLTLQLQSVAQMTTLIAPKISPSQCMAACCAHIPNSVGLPDFKRSLGANDVEARVKLTGGVALMDARRLGCAKNSKRETRNVKLEIQNSKLETSLPGTGYTG